jgi:hypothetical protein
MINGVLIDSDSCGAINPGVPVRGILTGTYTPTTTGIHTVEFYSYRNDIHRDIQNYFDDITLVPQTTDLTSDTIQFSASTPNLAKFDINPGPAYAGYKYWVLMSTSGNYPGLTNSGHWIPLNMDFVLMFTYKNPNSGMLMQTAGLLDANGQATAALRLPNAMGPTWEGKTVNVAFVLFQGATMPPIDYASMPVSIFFIP